MEKSAVPCLGWEHVLLFVHILFELFQLLV